MATQPPLLSLATLLEIVRDEPSKTSHALATKARGLRWSLTALAIAAALFAAGILSAGV